LIDAAKGGRTRHTNCSIAWALLATSALITPSLAQAATPAPKFLDTIDDHGVDLVNGLPILAMEEGGIGSGLAVFSR
jgi:hypothetical protein